MSAHAPVSVTEYTDPGCVVAWASEPRLRLLRLRYGHLVDWRRVFGLQIADALATDPGFHPERSAQAHLERWTEVARATGAPITGHLHWTHRSTGPASRAVISARRQGPVVADRVLRRLREALYLDGRPADSPGRLRGALAGVPGLDIGGLLAGLDTDRAHSVLRAEAAEARRVHPATGQAARAGSTPYPGPPVADGAEHRYAFPTLLFSSAGRTVVLPGYRSVEEYEAALSDLWPGITEEARPLPSAEELLAAHGTLTGPEVDLLAGGRPPRGALRTPTANGDVWRPAADPAAAPARSAEGAAR
ncbi:DsbA family protein [Nocardiopsis mangrovi]|uniref:DsbA family protein n=1 Tax=Nocardiopsis mangrovi TaxID=1179818 RepID=A0ABV9E6B6_9ACTN